MFLTLSTLEGCGSSRPNSTPAARSGHSPQHRETGCACRRSIGRGWPSGQWWERWCHPIRHRPASFPSAAHRRARRIVSSGRCKHSDAPWRPSGDGRIICLRRLCGGTDVDFRMRLPYLLASGSTFDAIRRIMGRMRVGCIPLVMMAALVVQAQSDSPVTKPAADLSIPAELTKTVRADKAHRGDPVEFTTLEAVL